MGGAGLSLSLTKQALLFRMNVPVGAIRESPLRYNFASSQGGSRTTPTLQLCLL